MATKEEKIKSLILEMGCIIRLLDEDNNHNEFWTQDGDYVNDPRFREVESLCANPQLTPNQHEGLPLPTAETMKSCPFCRHRPAAFIDEGYIFIYCENPDCVIFDNTMLADNWNTRPTETAYQKEIDRRDSCDQKIVRRLNTAGVSILGFNEGKRIKSKGGD